MRKSFKCCLKEFLHMHPPVKLKYSPLFSCLLLGYPLFHLFVWGFCTSHLILSRYLILIERFVGSISTLLKPELGHLYPARKFTVGEKAALQIAGFNQCCNIVFLPNQSTFVSVMPCLVFWFLSCAFLPRIVNQLFLKNGQHFPLSPDKMHRDIF